MKQPVILSYGLGVDSTAILLRWLTEPTSRDFNLDDLIVITAMTGDEWTTTKVNVEAHVLPLLRLHGIRYVQVARGRRHVTKNGDGVVILDDSSWPLDLHLDGAYRLSQEMFEAGTIPQSGGARLCSVHAKGDALDPIIARLTAGRPYRHVIGFEANEPKRAAKDRLFNTALRTGEYPLIDWGWDRDKCEEFIESHFGVTWTKSACVYCPFALNNIASRRVVFERYRREESAANLTLTMEHTALALNPKQGLVAQKRLVDLLVEAGYDDVVGRWRLSLARTPHALYEVRRILRGQKNDPTKLANAARSIERMATGTVAQMVDALLDKAIAVGLEPVAGEDGIPRLYVRQRASTFPTVEHFYTVAPAVVGDKAHANFESWWRDANSATPTVEEVTKNNAVLCARAPA